VRGYSISPLQKPALVSISFKHDPPVLIQCKPELIEALNNTEATL